MAELVVRQRIAAPVDEVFTALTDWSVHDRWMLLTHAEGGTGEGAEVRAYTGVGPLGFWDEMTVRVWEPPHRVVVRHTGRVVRGSASFEVKSLGDRAAEVVWSEWLLLPFGALGRLGWPLVRPLARAMLQVSLRRLASYVERTPRR